jgi:PAS domain-containing protein
MLLRSLTSIRKFLGWRTLILVGVSALIAVLAVAEFFGAYSVPSMSMSTILTAVLGSFLALCLAGLISAWRSRKAVSGEKMRIDGAINNMIQGLCMFDADNRLLVWNERYRSMYNIKPGHIWQGCTIRDLLDARIAAGTFPLDPARYDA